METLYPLRFREILRNYGFGNRWITEAYEKDGLPDNHRIAETWEVVNRGNESSIVLNGPLAGLTLYQLIYRYGTDFLGTDIVRKYNKRFPLLIKFLDASNVLGEQVHQNDALAAKQGLDDPGKTEGWYMLKVREGATIHCGHISGVTQQDVRTALVEGGLIDLMQEYTVKPGDGFLLHAGTMHYSKGGVLFYEIMQNSDVIIGLHKINPELSEVERERKLQSMLEGIHLEEGFTPKIRPVTISNRDNKRTYAFACQYFALERLDLQEDDSINCDGRRFIVLSQVQGSSAVRWSDGELLLRPGHTCLLPANMGMVTLHPGRNCAILKAYVPDLFENIVKPCREAGIEDRYIAGLGGFTVLNPLLDMLNIS